MRVAVAGASGYAGGELLRLILGHPELEVGPVAAASAAGRTVTALHPGLGPLADVVLAPTDAETLADADLVFLALPHGESAALVERLPVGLAVVDLGADFRLADRDAWERYYGGPHAGTWTYGLPELPGARAAVAASTRVANPGCYADLGRARRWPRCSRPGWSSRPTSSSWPPRAPAAPAARPATPCWPAR